MNKSYKVALISAIVLCVALLGYYATSGQPQGSQAPETPQDPRVALTPQPSSAPPKASDPTVTVTPPAARPSRPSTAPPSAPPRIVTPPASTNNEPPSIVFDGTPPAPPTQPLPTPTPAPAPVAASPPAKPAPPATTAYTIRPGDTLIDIAVRYYGSQNYWDEIAQANPMVDPVRLKPGDVIQLPDRNAIDRRPPVPTPRSDGTVIHIVRPGQTLSHIAQEHYGDPTLWRTIYLHNRELIGSSPNRLQAGTRLEIPPKP